MFDKKEEKHQKPKNVSDQSGLQDHSGEEKTAPTTDKSGKDPVHSNGESIAHAAEAPDRETNVTGRAVFAVETSGAGVVVRTAFLTEDARLLEMPAVFPDILHAMSVIDDLKAQVMQHFSRAAQVGAQVIANQSKQEQAAEKPASDGSAKP
ncbi:MAG: hypothetical protein RL357_1678 [Pseudomonadota bacterium]|jgi:hypothetical protein